MPAVLVHGVPETPAIWNDLRTQLARDDVIALQLPGFGCPRPDGFGATKEEYVAWLVDELTKIGKDGPIDLVGHDWGGGFTIRLVSTRPELVRSWVTDAAGLGDVDFEWHDFAKLWQTPGAGEEFFDQQLATPADQRGPLSELDRTMADCILALYRSATDVGREWGPLFRNVGRPGLVLIPSDDPFLAADRAKRAAQTAGAQSIELAGVGHWWMTEDPALGAATLEKFWAQLS
jgi:pimeloyl-ACP methyl ester carboxylesterase